MAETRMMAFIICNPATKNFKEHLEAYIEQLHVFSGDFIDFYMPGFTKVEVEGGSGLDFGSWPFDMADLKDFTAKIEERLDWRWSGEIELLVAEMQNRGRTFGGAHLCFKVFPMIKDGAIDSVASFCHEIIEISKQKKTLDQLSRHFVGDIALKSIIQSEGRPAKGLLKTIQIGRHFTVKQ